MTKSKQLIKQIEALTAAKATATAELEALTAQAQPGQKPSDLDQLTPYFLDEESRLAKLRPRISATQQSIAALTFGITPLQTELAALEKAEAADNASKAALAALDALNGLGAELDEAVERVKSILLKIKAVGSEGQQNWASHAVAHLPSPHGRAPGQLVQMSEVSLPNLEFREPPYIQYSPVILTVEPFDVFSAEKAAQEEAESARRVAHAAERKKARAEIAAQRAELAAEAAKNSSLATPDTAKPGVRRTVGVQPGIRRG